MATLRAWVMAGGGVKGAVTIPCMEDALRRLPTDERVEGFFGTSVGALHAAVLGSGMDRAEQLRRVALLREVYEGIRGNADLVRVPFPGGVLGKARSLLAGGGIYQFDGLRKLLARHVDLPGLAHSVGPYTAVVAVPLWQGEPVAVTPRMAGGNFLRYVVASAAAPGMAQAEVIGGEPWVDGGVTDVLPFRQALAWAKRVAGPEDTIEFTVFLTGPREPKPVPTPRHGKDLLARSLELLVNSQARKDVDRILVENERVMIGRSPPHRRLVRVSVYEPTIYGPPAYDFRPAGIRELLAHGATLRPWTGMVAP